MLSQSAGMVNTSQHLASVSVESLASATQRYNEEGTCRLLLLDIWMALRLLQRPLREFQRFGVIHARNILRSFCCIAVGELRGPLELEVAEAVSVCWVEENGRTVQVHAMVCCYKKPIPPHLPVS